MSAAGRARIAEAQRKRWAASRKEPAPPEATSERPKRRLSRAGRAAIVAATKKRWALKRAEAAQAQAASAKRAARVGKKATAKATNHKKVPLKKAHPVKKSAAEKAATSALPTMQTAGQ